MARNTSRRRRIQYPTARTDPARRIILQTLSDGWSIQRACREAGISRCTFYKWKDQEEEFAKQVADAIEQGTDIMEDELRRRAVDGVEAPVVSQGRIVTYEQKYSDQLMMFMIKSRRPEKYRDNASLDVNARHSFAGAAESLATKLLDIHSKVSTGETAKKPK